MNQELYDVILDTLFEEAIPGIQYFEEEDYGGGTPVNYVHYLGIDRQIEIIDGICDEYDIPLSGRRQVKHSVILGKGLSASLVTVERRREEEGLEPVSQFLENPDDLEDYDADRP